MKTKRATTLKPSPAEKLSAILASGDESAIGAHHRDTECDPRSATADAKRIAMKKPKSITTPVKPATADLPKSTTHFGSTAGTLEPEASPDWAVMI
jgi:hypothetical protein